MCLLLKKSVQMKSVVCFCFVLCVSLHCALMKIYHTECVLRFFLSFSLERKKEIFYIVFLFSWISCVKIVFLSKKLEIYFFFKEKNKSQDIINILYYHHHQKLPWRRKYTQYKRISINEPTSKRKTQPKQKYFLNWISFFDMDFSSSICFFIRFVLFALVFFSVCHFMCVVLERKEIHTDRMNKKKHSYFALIVSFAFVLYQKDFGRKSGRTFSRLWIFCRFKSYQKNKTIFFFLTFCSLSFFLSSYFTIACFAKRKRKDNDNNNQSKKKKTRRCGKVAVCERSFVRVCACASVDEDANDVNVQTKQKNLYWIALVIFFLW